MADFTALKTAIQNAIKQNGNEEITGDILQDVLLAIVSTLGDSAINDLVTALANEVAARQNADGTLQQNITNEATTRGNADTALGTRIDNEVTARENADTALSNRITAITDAIDNGYVYAGIATTSTEPATGKVFYLTTATGVFTNFGGITVNTKGIKILKKVGSTWTSDTVIVMDDTPTENSTNLVKSGGVYASIASVLSKIAEGYLYVGIATAATNPSTPTTKVFYIAVAAGTYTNFLDSGSAALVLTQGINILKYNGTAWSVEQVWGVDDEPTAGSDNLVKSGGVFNDIMTNGSAFDLSAYNNGTTYADLNAALTALNTLPAAYKKGGMSLKFVLTSDNKYAQFRCKAQSFTTNTDEWAIETIDSVKKAPFINAEVDKENKILSARKTDGTKVEFGDFEVKGDIINDKLESQIQSKVEKEEGKSLIPTQFIQEIENPEFIKADVDKNKKLLEGTRKDGSKFFGGDVDIEGKVTPKEVSTERIILNGKEISPAATVAVNRITKDPENRLKIDVDKNNRIISYRDKYGLLHENVGIEVKDLFLSKDGLNRFKQELNISDSSYKSPNLPKYGTVNITQETFYLVKTAGVSSLDDVHVEQILEDTVANALLRLSIGRFFKNGTSDAILNFASSDVHEENGVFYATTKVKKINNICYYQNTLGTSNADRPVRDTVVDGYSIVAPYDAELAEGDTKDVIFEVDEYSWVPDIRVWFIDKSVEHHCLVDIDFGYFLSKINVPVGIKFQGSSTTTQKKKSFRFTFYKKANYAKKDKIKIGEMLRLSGYNLKANATDNTRIKEYILYYILLSVWNKRPIVDRFPWDEKYGFYTGATGFIKGFPISTSIGGNFYGMHIFSLKKDEKNYMLDGEDSSGIFVSGTRRDPTCWTTAIASNWEDEMMDEMSQDTADALNTFFAFINDRLVIDEVPVSFNKENIPERMDVQGFIDYFICLQAFLMWDSICRNMILYSGSDKKKFYPYFYDLDLSMQDKYPYNADIFDIEYNSTPSIMNDMSLWTNIKDLYWDEIINRWCELRNTVLSDSYIVDVYNGLTESIPDSDFNNENIKWGTLVSKANGEILVEKIVKRLNWLDENYFKV